MLHYEPDQLDYFSLLGLGRNLDPSTCKSKLRCAVLADCAPQQVAGLLKTLFYLNAIDADIYEADFDSVELEVLNPQSGLYAFKPELVFILNTTQALKHKYYASADQSSFAAEQASRMTGLWTTLGQRTEALIVQGNLVTPLERFFGNFDTRVHESLTGVVREINARLSESLPDHKNVFINDLEALAGYEGRKTYFDEKLWVLSKTPAALPMLPHLAQGTVDIYLAAAGRGVKCVILDLDNTMWGGVIGDDGLEGIALGHMGEGEAFLNLQNFVLQLKKRGIILAVCSKNDHHNAILPFQKHPDMVLKEEDIAVFVANWNNKGDNIKHIQEVLNIGFDSMVFLDDSAFERNLVREMLPAVIVPEMPEDPSEYVKFLNELNLFETTTYTAEDRKRSEMYREQAKRKELETSIDNIEDYLKSLEMKVHVTRFDEFNLPRIVQLIGRSNQFNLTTSRYSEAQCADFMADEAGSLPLYVRVRDRFGDYGLISVVVLRKDGELLHIDEWLMSCRVLSRGVEQHVMNHVFAHAAANGFTRVLGYYRPTEKNGMVAEFYKSFDFELESSDDQGGTTWSKEVDRYQPRTVYLESADY